MCSAVALERSIGHLQRTFYIQRLQLRTRDSTPCCVGPSVHPSAVRPSITLHFKRFFHYCPAIRDGGAAYPTLLIANNDHHCARPWAGRALLNSVERR